MNQSPKEIKNIANLYTSIYTNKDVLDEELQELKLFMIEWYNILVEKGLVKGQYFGEEVLLDEGFWDQVATKGPKVVKAVGQVLKQVTGYGTKPTTRLGTAVRIGQQSATPLVAFDAGGTRTRLQRGVEAGVKKAMEDPEKKKEYQYDSFDVFDTIKGHLIDEGYADTEEAAIKIMANMSEEWRTEILDEGRVDWETGKLPIRSTSGAKYFKRGDDGQMVEFQPTQSPKHKAQSSQFRKFADATTTRGTQGKIGKKGALAKLAAKQDAAIQATTQRHRRQNG